MCCYSRSLQLFSKEQRTGPVTTEYQESLHQAQDNINLVDYSPNGLFESGRSPMYTFGWLGVRKTLVGLSFEAEKSHFSFLFVLLHLWWMTLIFSLLFYDSWEKKKDSCCANIILIPLAWREPTTREILDLFFFSFRSDRFWATLPLVPHLKLGVSPGKMSHFTCMQISWNSTRLPLCRKKGLLSLTLLALNESHLLPEAKWECSCEVLHSSRLC